MCETRVLNHGNDALVSYCVHCKSIYFWYNNLLLTFNHDSFTVFRDMVNDIEFEECSTIFPDGIERAVMHSPCRSIRFTFTFGEWNRMKGSIEDAVLMEQVYACM
ncbi:DUF6686 family protein [Chitinophaga sedimenti]|uniref:DUF6686 family protein n=1 Tax=Chitinophaga sedimenti TaxID=2033606 RepID=UPI0027E07C95|nr:DUF6686 family protein [Chitinophaga sedimenti]